MIHRPKQRYKFAVLKPVSSRSPMAEEPPLSSKISTTFRHDMVKDLLKSKFHNSKNKISDEAVDLMVEVAKVMVIEASARACYQTQLEAKTTVSLDQVECILAQMMLDFP